MNENDWLHSNNNYEIQTYGLKKQLTCACEFIPDPKLVPLAFVPYCASTGNPHIRLEYK